MAFSSFMRGAVGWFGGLIDEEELMPVFEYKGLDAGAKSCTGVIDAETPRDAREKLRLKKIYVTNIDAVGEAPTPTVTKSGKKVKAKRKGSAFAKLGQARRTVQVSQFTRQLSTLLSAGIPITQALTALVEQTEDKDLETIIRDIREKVSTGIDIGDALAAHPLYFSPLFVSMIRAGEASGELADVLSRLGDFMQKQTRLRGKVMAAMTYPAILMILCAAVVTFLLISVVPNITEMLVQQQIPQPLPTKIVVGLSDTMLEYWYIFLALAIGGTMFFKAWSATDAGAHNWDRFKLRSPVFGNVITKVAVSRFATTFAVLLRSGLPALEGLRIVKDVVGNKVLSKVIGEVHDSIIEGTDISTPIKKSGVFPPVVGYMIAVGEQTGELENLLERISEAYDEEVDLAVQKMTASLEPIMIVFMAVVVGGIIAAVMLPLMQISAGAR